MFTCNASIGPPRIRSATWWPVALIGQFLVVFALVALSGPGRIDIIDGQTRYEVARSMVDHGDRWSGTRLLVSGLQGPR